MRRSDGAAPQKALARIGRATSTRQNRIRSIWEAGGAVVNGWLAIPSGFAAETMAHAGWDSLTIDMQHGIVDYLAAVQMLTAISTTETVPVVRVPWLEPGIVMKMLDAGAYGLICPMVNTGAEAEALVAATHYQPRGTRSFGPVRALLYGGADYLQHADDTVVVFAMIETRTALDNLDDILAVKGLDAVYIGPSDLSLALGYAPPARDDLEPPVEAAVERILSGAKRRGVVAGIHNATPEGAAERIAQGFQFVTAGSDTRLLTAGSKDVIARMGRRDGKPAPR